MCWHAHPLGICWSIRNLEELLCYQNHGRWLIGKKLVYPVARLFAEEIMNLPDERKTRRLSLNSLVVDCQITWGSSRWRRPGVGRVHSYTVLRTFKWPVGMTHSLEIKWWYKTNRMSTCFFSVPRHIYFSLLLTSLGSIRYIVVANLTSRICL